MNYHENILRNGLFHITTIEQNIKGLCNESSEVAITKLIEFIDSIFRITQLNVRELFISIKNSGYDRVFIMKCIKQVEFSRPKQLNYISLLKSMLEKELGYQWGTCLSEKDIINSNIDLKAIYNDDVNTFVKISGAHNFDPNKSFCCSWDSNERITYIQYMAYFGSVKCFKYALLDGSYNLNNICKYAIEGGNTEIIHLLEQNSLSFDSCFVYSISSHRYEISDWLLNNYKMEEVDLSDCTKFINVRTFFFIIKNMGSISKDSINKVFLYSVNSSNFDIARYLVKEKHANVEERYDRKTAIHFACINNNMSEIKYLVSECKVNADAKDNTSRSAINYMCINGNLEAIKFLIKEMPINIEISILYDAVFYKRKEIVEFLIKECNAEYCGSYKTPALKIAIETKSMEMVKFVVEELHANVNEIVLQYIFPFRVLKPLLHIAYEKQKFDIIRYLIDNCQADIDLKEEKRDKNGNKISSKTLLQKACENDDIWMVRYLIEECKAIYEEKNYEGKTLFEVAIESKSIKVVQYLYEKCNVRRKIEQNVDRANKERCYI